MRISTDEAILYQNGFITINNTLLFSWIVMFILIVFAILLRISINKNKQNNKNNQIPTGIQNFFEALLDCIDGQIRQISTRKTEIVFPFIATLFLYIVLSNLISLIPLADSPTGSLSTTLALAFSMFIFSIWFGIKDKGFIGYFKKYFQPIPLLLPLNLISDLSKIVSLSVRLYGNIMSSGVILIILSQITFLSAGFPIIISLLSTITGVIQAYIFSALSMIAISSDS